jgi:hypothetical protein
LTELFIGVGDHASHFLLHDIPRDSDVAAPVVRPEGVITHHSIAGDFTASYLTETDGVRASASDVLEVIVLNGYPEDCVLAVFSIDIER